MELDYNKKDIAKSPKAKAVVQVLPEGYELYEKRGMWHVKSEEKLHEIFVSKRKRING